MTSRLLRGAALAVVCLLSPFARRLAAQAPSPHHHRGRRASITVPAVRANAPRSVAALQEDLAGMLHRRSRGGHWGILVVSLTRGDTLFSVSPDIQVQPASTMKLFTSALALERLGPDYQFSTDVLRDGPLAAGGVIEGDLILRGDGDPSLSPRFFPGDAGASMRQLAQAVAAAGVRRVNGDIVGDATAFDGQRIPSGWLTRYLRASYAARVSALALNDNIAFVAVSPGTTGRAAIVALEPSSTAVPIVNGVRTVLGTSGARIAIHSRPDGTIEAHGWIGAWARKRTYEIDVEDPALFTVGAFRDALKAQGIVLDGTVRLARAPTTALRVTSLVSPPLTRIIAAMNRESINNYAELLFRDAVRGPDRLETGSAELGGQLLQHFLTDRAGVAPDAVVVADGSGLSTLDRVTPRAMVHLLTYADGAPWRATLHASLPVAGESELLRNRMRQTAAQGNLHAKTGTTNNVIALGGYVTALDGELLAFSFIYNGIDRWNAKATIDGMGATLASFVRE